ncbi:monocyte to macrophage differentiation factor-like [Acropora millepora]|uniref:monocyte to macrophage differentiation factor-like n=1 Tax=Acropora millepora TaxID=45264 RepID=UPI0010FCBAEA|nr:monocyte to macrophage differentiation factor-like [Acropora millepora]
MPCLSCSRLMNLPAKKNEAYQPTVIEQSANIITHGIFVIPAMFAAFELHRNSKALSASHQFIAEVYGTSFILVFLISTLFHVVCIIDKFRSLRFFLHLSDRCIIYFFIAASYMPWFLLKDVSGIGDIVSRILWCLAVAGTVYSYVFHEKYKTMETVFYLILGICPSLPLALASTDKAGLAEIAFGGAFYVSGVIFFKSDGRIPFAHAIWHLFCASGAWSHFYSVYTHFYLGKH